jgi:tetratricopeptide (TPR) repeat protein
VATKKNPAKLAAALQPELNRLSKATRRLAQQDAEQNAAEEDQEAAQEETPKTQQRVLPLRPGLRRGDTRGEPDAAPPASVPRALSKSIRGDVKVESIPDLGVLVLTGNEQDVQAVMEVIQEIERLSAATAPEVQVAFLRHVSSEALATLLTEELRFAEADKLHRQVIEAQRRTLGPEHAATLLSMGNLGFDLIEEKNYSEAEKVLREALAGLRRVLGPSHEVTAGAAYKLARVLALVGKRDEAFVNLRAYAESVNSVDDIQHVEKDDSFQSLHGDPRFDTLLAATRQRIAAAPKQH